MDTKLTLTIDQSIIRKANEYARQKERSLSDLIESYLRDLTKEVPGDEALSPLLKSLKGSFKEPQKSDYKTELSDRLAKKYL